MRSRKRPASPLTADEAHHKSLYDRMMYVHLNTNYNHQDRRSMERVHPPQLRQLLFQLLYAHDYDGAAQVLAVLYSYFKIEDHRIRKDYSIMDCVQASVEIIKRRAGPDVTPVLHFYDALNAAHVPKLAEAKFARETLIIYMICGRYREAYEYFKDRIRETPALQSSLEVSNDADERDKKASVPWVVSSFILNQDALEFLRRAMEQDPSNSLILEYYVQILVIGGKVVEACDCLENFCFIYPGNSHGHRMLVSFLEEYYQNGTEAIAQCYLNWIKSDPDALFLLEKIDQLRRIDCLVQSRSYVEVLCVLLDYHGGRKTEASSNLWKKLADEMLRLQDLKEIHFVDLVKSPYEMLCLLGLASIFDDRKWWESVFLVLPDLPEESTFDESALYKAYIGIFVCTKGWNNVFSQSIHESFKNQRNTPSSRIFHKFHFPSARHHGHSDTREATPLEWKDSNSLALSTSKRNNLWPYMDGLVSRMPNLLDRFEVIQTKNDAANVMTMTPSLSNRNSNRNIRSDQLASTIQDWHEEKNKWNLPKTVMYVPHPDRPLTMYNCNANSEIDSDIDPADATIIEQNYQHLLQQKILDESEKNVNIIAAEKEKSSPTKPRTSSASKSRRTVSPSPTLTLVSPLDPDFKLLPFDELGLKLGNRTSRHSLRSAKDRLLEFLVQFGEEKAWEKPPPNDDEEIFWSLPQYRVCRWMFVWGKFLMTDFQLPHAATFETPELFHQHLEVFAERCQDAFAEFYKMLSGVTGSQDTLRFVCHVLDHYLKSKKFPELPPRAQKYLLEKVTQTLENIQSGRSYDHLKISSLVKIERHITRYFIPKPGSAIVAVIAKISSSRKKRKLRPKPKVMSTLDPDYELIPLRPLRPCTIARNALHPLSVKEYLAHYLREFHGNRNRHKEYTERQYDAIRWTFLWGKYLVTDFQLASPDAFSNSGEFSAHVSAFTSQCENAFADFYVFLTGMNRSDVDVTYYFVCHLLEHYLKPSRFQFLPPRVRVYLGHKVQSTMRKLESEESFDKLNIYRLFKIQYSVLRYFNADHASTGASTSASSVDRSTASPMIDAQPSDSDGEENGEQEHIVGV